MPRTTVDTDIGSRACQRQDTTTPSAQTSPLPSRSPRPHLGRTSPPKAPRQPDPRPARRASPKPSRSPRKYPSLLHSRRLFDSPQPEGTVRVLIDKALRGYVLSPLAAPGPAGSGWFSVRSSIGIAEAGPLRAAVEATPSFTYKAEAARIVLWVWCDQTAKCGWGHRLPALLWRSLAVGARRVRRFGVAMGRLGRLRCGAWWRVLRPWDRKRGALRSVCPNNAQNISHSSRDRLLAL